MCAYPECYLVVLVDVVMKHATIKLAEANWSAIMTDSKDKWTTQLVSDSSEMFQNATLGFIGIYSFRAVKANGSWKLACWIARTDG